MKRFIPGIAILLILSLTACSAPKTPPKDTGDASNSQSEGIIRLDEGEWPVNEYTEGLPVPTGTVAWAMLDTEHGNFSISIAGIDEKGYDNYMELLIQEGFSVVENAATQAARNCIIPHMHMYAIEDVVKQALSYSQRHNRKVVFAYLLLPGINDRSSDIRQLAKWFKGKNVMINVLQYNPTSNSKIRAPQKQEMVAFKHQLEQTGLEVTMRVSHGREIKAACGQLANTYNKAKKQQK